MQKSSDSLCTTVKENDDDFFYWDKNNVTELANAVYFLSLPYIEKGSNEKAGKSLNLLINNSEIVKRENAEKINLSQAKIEYKGKSFYIPEKIKSTMHDIIYENLPAPGEYEGEQEDPYPNEFAKTVDEAVATAAAILVGYIDAATTMTPSSGGGGGGSTGGWRDKEDENERARKAAHLAATMHTPKHTPQKRKGLHL